MITPTRDPLTELATHLAAVGGGDIGAVRVSLAERPELAHLEVRRALLADSRRRSRQRLAPEDQPARLVLVVDQFEQVFTLNPGPEVESERWAFISALCAAASKPAGDGGEPPALVVIAVRGDYWDRCAAYPQLAAALQEAQFVVGPMTESDLRLAITGPAEVAGLRVDPILVDTILSDLQTAGADQRAGVLPLLSQAMSLTWERREGDRLTSRGYSQIGGVSHAVQRSADSAYEALPAWQQALARELLSTMAVVGREGSLARRPVAMANMYSSHLDAERAGIDAVLEAFAIRRLIVLDEGVAQIAHDALLRSWSRFRSWLEADQAGWILYGQFADDAAAWQDHHSDRSFLYRGVQLAAVQQAARSWVTDQARYPVLTSSQRAFLRASERALARSTRQRKIVAASLIALLITSVVSAFIAVAAASNAKPAAQ